MTHRERELLDFVACYQRDHRGVSPTWEEMRLGLGLSSRSHVSKLVTSLIAQKRLKHSHFAHRSIVLIDHDPFNGVPTEQLVAELQRRGIRVAACGECAAVPGSAEAHACTRSDCGLSDRFHAEGIAA